MTSLRSNSFRAALIGLDHPHAPLYLASLIHRREIEAVLLWNERPTTTIGALSSHQKVKLFTQDLDSLLARDDFDFAIVCVRTDQVAAIARRVVSSGKHLLVEKPGGMNAAEIRTVMKAARDAGVRACPAYFQRFQPAMQEAKRMIGSRAIGRLLSIEGRMLTTQVRFRDPKIWFFHRRQAGGGILTWLGCHFLDLMAYVSGERITAVFAREAILSGERIDVEDQAVLAIEFESGAIGTFNAGYALAHSGGGFTNAGGYDTYLAWNGHDGRVVWPGMQPRLHVESPVSRGPAVREMTFRRRKTEGYGGAAGAAFFSCFLESLRGRADPPATLHDAVRVAQVVEAAARSASSGRLVKIPD